MMVIGENIKLRPMSFRDIKDKIHWMNSENSWRLDENPNNQISIVNPFGYGLRQVVSIIKKKKKRDEIWTSLEIETHTGRHIGFINSYNVELKNMSGVGLGIIIPNQNNQSKGFGYEAIKLYIDYLLSGRNINYLFYFVNASNKKSIGLIEKIGFEVLEEYIFEDELCFYMRVQNVDA